MKKTLIASIIAVASALAATSASAAITVGDSLTLDYLFPDVGTKQETTTFSFAGDGQVVDTQGGITSATIFSDHVVFADFCGDGCTQTGSDWNGPALTNNTNAGAFGGWIVTADTMGINGFSNNGATISVNWQGLDANGMTTVSAVPEPATVLTMLAGLVAVAGIARRRKA